MSIESWEGDQDALIYLFLSKFVRMNSWYQMWHAIKAVKEIVFWFNDIRGVSSVPFDMNYQNL